MVIDRCEGYPGHRSLDRLGFLDRSAQLVERARRAKKKAELLGEFPRLQWVAIAVAPSSNHTDIEPTLNDYS